ncbi:hypothetical protein MMC30_008273 [Trapelia coarctata]|nr:hypothetical protein [Trapelia coarctata]
MAGRGAGMEDVEFGKRAGGLDQMDVNARNGIEAVAFGKRWAGDDKMEVNARNGTKPLSFPPGKQVELSNTRHDPFFERVFEAKKGDSEKFLPIFAITLEPQIRADGLHPMHIYNDVVLNPTVEGDDAVAQAKKAVVAALSHAYTYMVEVGVGYGVIMTGNSLVFPRIPPHEKLKLAYRLFEPQKEFEAGGSSAWSCNASWVTAVGQVLAFAVRALQVSPLGPDWRADAVVTGKRWSTPPGADLQGDVGPPEKL